MFDNKKFLAVGGGMGKPMELIVPRFFTTPVSIDSFTYLVGQKFKLEFIKGGAAKVEMKLAGQPDSAYKEIPSGSSGDVITKIFDDRDFILDKTKINEDAYVAAMDKYAVNVGEWGNTCSNPDLADRLESMFLDGTQPNARNLVFRFYGKFKSIRFGRHGNGDDLKAPANHLESDKSIVIFKTYGDCKFENIQFLNTDSYTMEDATTVDNYPIYGVDHSSMVLGGAWRHPLQGFSISSVPHLVNKAIPLPMPSSFNNMDRMFYCCQQILSNIGNIDTSNVSTMRETFAGSIYLKKTTLSDGKIDAYICSIPLPKLGKTNKVTDISGCFKGAYATPGYTYETQIPSNTGFIFSEVKYMMYTYAHTSYFKNNKRLDMLKETKVVSFEGCLYKSKWEQGAVLYFVDNLFYRGYYYCKSTKDMFYGAGYIDGGVWRDDAVEILPPDPDYGYRWSSLETMEGMLDSCTLRINVSNISAEYVKSVKRLFAMTEYKDLNVEQVPKFAQHALLGTGGPEYSLSLFNVKDMSEMYRYNKFAFPLGDLWDTYWVENMDYMFEEARVILLDNVDKYDRDYYGDANSKPLAKNLDPQFAINGSLFADPAAFTINTLKAPTPKQYLKSIKGMFKNFHEVTLNWVNTPTYRDQQTARNLIKMSFFNRMDEGNDFYIKDANVVTISPDYYIDNIEDASYAFYVDVNRFNNLFALSSDPNGEPIPLSRMFTIRSTVSSGYVDYNLWYSLKNADYMFAVNRGNIIDSDEPINGTAKLSIVTDMYCPLFFSGAKLESAEGMFLGIDMWFVPLFVRTPYLTNTNYMYAGYHTYGRYDIPYNSTTYSSTGDLIELNGVTQTYIPSYATIKPVTAKYMYSRSFIFSGMFTDYPFYKTLTGKVNLERCTDITGIFKEVTFGTASDEHDGFTGFESGLKLPAKADYALYNATGMMNISYQVSMIPNEEKGSAHIALKNMFFKDEWNCGASSLDHAFDGVEYLWGDFFFPAGANFPHLTSARYAFANMKSMDPAGKIIGVPFHLSNMTFPLLEDGEGMFRLFQQIRSLKGFYTPMLKNAKEMFYTVFDYSMTDPDNPFMLWEMPDPEFSNSIVDATRLFAGITITDRVTLTYLNTQLSEYRWTNCKTLESVIQGSTLLPDVSAWTFPVCESFRLAFSNLYSAGIILQTSKNWALPATCKDLSYMFSGSNFDIHDQVDTFAMDTTACTELTMECMFGYTDFDWNVSMDMSNVTNISEMFCSTPFNGAVNHFNFTKLDSMIRVFADAKNFNRPINFWNVSTVTSMHGVFNGAVNFAQSLAGWDTRNVTDMSYMFNESKKLRSITGINTFNTAKVTNTSYMFANTNYVDMEILFPTWNLSNVENMEGMFYNSFIGDTSVWPTNWNNLPKLKTLKNFFYGLSTTPTSPYIDMSGCNFPKLETTNGMLFGFQKAKILLWGSANPALTDISYMFYNCVLDKVGGINSFNVSSVTDMTATFMYTTANDRTNTNISFSYWNTANVTKMGSMFRWSSLNLQTFYGRNTSKVTDMSYMFANNQSTYYLNVSAFDVSKVTNFEGCFYELKAGTDIQYLELWNTSSATSMKLMWAFEVSGITYPPCANWNVSKVTDFSGMFKNNTGANANISGWNTISAVDMNQMFRGAIGFKDVNFNGWNVSNVENFAYMFFDCNGFTSPLNSWNIVKAKYMQYMFAGTYGKTMTFAPDISTWGPKMGNVVSIAGMYNCNSNVGARSLDNWNVSKVTDFSYLFSDSNFSGTVANWNTLSATMMNDMFRNTQFNGAANHLYLYYVTDISRMFWSATKFNQPINSWNTSRVVHADSFLRQAASFNQPIFTNVSSLENANSMFQKCTAFNQPSSLSSWRPAKLKTALTMFSECGALNISPTTANLANWSLPELVNASDMFALCHKFNSPMTNWGMQKVQNANALFHTCIALSQPIVWQSTATSLVTMWATFYNCLVFNHPFSSLDVSKVTNAEYLLDYAGAFNSAIPLKWNKLTAATRMFAEAKAFRQSLARMCVPLLATAPTNFSLNSGITALPVWGTCPA